jgi:hypothetical protein
MKRPRGNLVSFGSDVSRREVCAHVGNEGLGDLGR